MSWCIDKKKLKKIKLKNIAILNVRGVDNKCILWGNSGNKAVSILNNSILEDKDTNGI